MYVQFEEESRLVEEVNELVEVYEEVLTEELQTLQMGLKDLQQEEGLFKEQEYLQSPQKD